MSQDIQLKLNVDTKQFDRAIHKICRKLFWAKWKHLVISLSVCALWFTVVFVVLYLLSGGK